MITRFPYTFRSFRLLKSSSDTISPIFLPFLYPQHRSASVLSNLRDLPGAFRTKKRLGRGPSSGKGKTSGRGHKGQKQHGKVPAGFNGGQTPDEVVRGKRGFVNKYASRYLSNGYEALRSPLILQACEIGPCLVYCAVADPIHYHSFSIDLQTVNLSKISNWIAQGRIDPSRPITIKELRESRCVTNIKDGVKLLANGSEDVQTPMNVIISRASAQAIAAIESAGGTVATRYYTNMAIRRICQGKMDPVHSLQSKLPEEQWGARRKCLYRLPDPTSRKDIEYYRDPAHRGYLSYTVPEGHGPSLFFKTPGTGRMFEKKAVKSKSAASENRIW